MRKVLLLGALVAIAAAGFALPSQAMAKEPTLNPGDGKTVTEGYWHHRGSRRGGRGGTWGGGCRGGGGAYYGQGYYAPPADYAAPYCAGGTVVAPR